MLLCVKDRGSPRFAHVEGLRVSICLDIEKVFPNAGGRRALPYEDSHGLVLDGEVGGFSVDILLRESEVVAQATLSDTELDHESGAQSATQGGEAGSLSLSRGLRAHPLIGLSLMGGAPASLTECAMEVFAGHGLDRFHCRVDTRSRGARGKTKHLRCDGWSGHVLNVAGAVKCPTGYRGVLRSGTSRTKTRTGSDGS